MPIYGATQIEQMQMCPTRSYDESILQVRRAGSPPCPLPIGSCASLLGIVRLYPDGSPVLDPV